MPDARYEAALVKGECMILSRDVLNKIYFAFHVPGSVDLVIDPSIRYGNGPITLSAAAAEDLLINLQTNADIARFMASAQKGGPIELHDEG